MNPRVLGRPRHPRRVFGEMTGPERIFREHIEMCVLRGEALLWRYECLRLLLAERTYFLPDFYVVRHDHIDLVEVKPAKWDKEKKRWTYFSQEDSLVKLKMAAELYPEFVFWLVACDVKEGVVLQKRIPVRGEV